MACDAEIAARLRPIANADAARIFMEGPFLLVRDEITGPNDANNVAIKPPDRLTSDAGASDDAIPSDAGASPNGGGASGRDAIAGASGVPSGLPRA